MPNNPRRLAAGTLLSGRFRIEKRLGRGATATVYLAEDTGSGEPVALKAMHADLHATGSNAAERMKREIELVHRIVHPGVCRIYDLYTDDRLLFFTMQYVRGHTLDVVLKTEGRLIVSRTARIVRAVCRALFAAHALDILHRDLKPSNIMLAPNDQPIILDFGYATGPNVGKLTATGEWVGTLYYAAPELLKDEPNSKVSDVYSLAVILYQCLTGQLPFNGSHPGEIADALLFRDPIPPRELCPDLSPELEAIVLKAMRRKPADRFAAVMDLEYALAPFDTVSRVWGVPEVLPLPIAETTDPHLEAPSTDEATEVHDRRRPQDSWSDSQPSQPTQVRANPLAAPESPEVLAPEPAPAAPPALRPPAASPQIPSEPQPRANATTAKRTRRVRYVPPQRGGFALDAGVRLPDRATPTLARDPKPTAPARAKDGTRRHAPIDAATSPRQQYEEQSRLLTQEKRERGLASGDNLTLDSLERTALVEMSRGRWGEAANYATLALAEARSTAVDAAFVGAKIRRFDKLMRAAGGLQALGRFEAALEPVMQAFEKRDFRAANLALNRAFALLEK